jgi:hypothetical protein
VRETPAIAFLRSVIVVEHDFSCSKGVRNTHPDISLVAPCYILNTKEEESHTRIISATEENLNPLPIEAF